MPMRVTVRTVLGASLALAFSFAGLRASALEISNRYRSPRNPERKVRASTQFIVLHTTEAPARSSLNKLSDRGEAHFCVTEVGQIYAIVDRDREAFHAGRSMWNGKEDVDKFSIGIECVGNHDKAMPTVQLSAIRELVEELQRMYKLSDDKVVCHSHVAYGSPNKWQKRRHRGRKRCGMLFATPTVRRILGLNARPAFDADTRAGRLVVADDYLRSVLYGPGDMMAGKYGPAPKPPQVVATAVKPKPVVKKPVEKPKPAEKPKHAEKPKPQLAAKPAAPVGAPTSVAQLKSRGYAMKGTVSKENSASKIAGRKWNASDTYYTIRNKVISGRDIDAAHIEKGMCVWMKK